MTRRVLSCFPSGHRVYRAAPIYSGTQPKDHGVVKAIKCYSPAFLNFIEKPWPWLAVLALLVTAHNRYRRLYSKLLCGRCLHGPSRSHTESEKELGYLDEVVNDEDLIVLKLEQASPSKRFLPEDIGGSGDARRLSISQQAFVARRAFVGNLRYSAALFTGSKEFLSLKTFFETAKYVLKNVRPLALVHTRKSIFKLVSCF
ncbi:hypothetical protein MRX96_058222 [Rhipicephalus microplus]